MSHFVAETTAHILPNISGVGSNGRRRSASKTVHCFEIVLFVLLLVFSPYLLWRIFNIGWVWVKVTIQPTFVWTATLPFWVMVVYIKFCLSLSFLNKKCFTGLRSTSSPYTFISLLKVDEWKLFGLNLVSASSNWSLILFSC